MKTTLNQSIKEVAPRVNQRTQSTPLPTFEFVISCSTDSHVVVDTECTSPLALFFAFYSRNIIKLAQSYKVSYRYADTVAMKTCMLKRQLVDAVGSSRFSQTPGGLCAATQHCVDKACQYTVDSIPREKRRFELT
jgi:Tfp pilus tip-associated adhesin PilY1